MKDKESLEILWKMARSNELYSFDMFWGDIQTWLESNYVTIEFHEKHLKENKDAYDAYIMERLEKMPDELINPYPKNIFKSEEHRFYRQIYDNAKKDLQDAIDNLITEIKENHDQETCNI